MIHFLNKIRRSIEIPLSKKLLYSTLVLITGVILGVISKLLDTTPSNYLPYFLQIFDLRDFFSSMGIWLFMTCISPFLAFVCWYAKGKGLIALAISSVIFMFISRQAFAFGFWYLDIRSVLDFSLWIAAIFVLYQSPKQIIQVVSIGLLLFFLTAQFHLFMGML